MLTSKRTNRSLAPLDVVGQNPRNKADAPDLTSCKLHDAVRHSQATAWKESPRQPGVDEDGSVNVPDVPQIGESQNLEHGEFVSDQLFLCVAVASLSHQAEFERWITKGGQVCSRKQPSDCRGACKILSVDHPGSEVPGKRCASSSPRLPRCLSLTSCQLRPKLEFQRHNPDERPQTRGSYRIDSWAKASRAPSGDWNALPAGPSTQTTCSVTPLCSGSNVPSSQVNIKGGSNGCECKARTKRIA